MRERGPERKTGISSHRGRVWSRGGCVRAPDRGTRPGGASILARAPGYRDAPASALDFRPSLAQ